MSIMAVVRARARASVCVVEQEVMEPDQLLLSLNYVTFP